MTPVQAVLVAAVAVGAWGTGYFWGFVHGARERRKIRRGYP